MKRTRDTFVFPKEIGMRLRELRLRAGLSQAAVAHLMGRRGKKAGTLVTRLEKGRLAFPSIALVADYLRAVRRGFADILDFLDAYTSRPPALDVAVEEQIRELRLPRAVENKLAHYDVKTEMDRRLSKGRKREVSAEVRLERARKLGAAWMQRRKLEAWLREAMAEVEGGGTMATRFILSVHGRRVWGILKRTRSSGDLTLALKNSKDRAEQLAAALAAAIAENSAPEQSVRYIQDTVTELFNVMEKAGELDFVPTMLQLDEERARAKQEAKRRAQDAKPLPSQRYGSAKPPSGQLKGGDPTGNQRMQALYAMQREVVAELEAEKMPTEVRTGVISAFWPAFDICRETMDKPEERERRLEALCARARHPAETRRAVARFVYYFEKLRHDWLPQSPAGQTS